MLTHVSDRDSELSLIEVAIADEKSRQFEILMALFDLNQERSEHRGVLIQVLRQGQWKSAPHPLKNIRKAVLSRLFSRRDASERRMGDALGLSSKAIGALSHRSDTLEALPGPDGVWRQGGGRRPEDDVSRTYYVTEEAERPGLSISQVRPEFIRIVNPKKHLSKQEQEYTVDSFKIIDWHKALNGAGLDDFEQSIFHCVFGHARGQSKAIEWYTAEGYDRHVVVAAIKRVRRKLPKIRRILIRS